MLNKTIGNMARLAGGPAFAFGSRGASSVIINDPNQNKYQEN